MAESANLSMSELQAKSGDRISQALAPWLESQIAGAANMQLRNIVEPKQGLTSDTILFDAVWQAGGGQQTRPLVARIQRNTVCPMLADVFFQHDVMQLIAAHSEVSVPHIVFAERAGVALGQPFFLMDRVNGRVPSDFPLFHAEGWVFDLPVEQRARLWWNAIDEMAKLHRIDSAHFALIGKLDEDQGALFYLHNFIRKWLEWAAQGQSFPVLEEALLYLCSHVPAGEKCGLIWNDARMGNTMFADDLSVAALFDFEVASLGPAEIDLAWWLYCEDLFSEQFGAERLAGIPHEQEAIKGFERLYDRAMPDFDYYLAIAALKHAVLSIRDYSNGKTVETPDALPGFALDRLVRSIERHKQAHA
jgi:aminoglycoside phosphotransferase (APT) family kinase protein